MRPKNLESIFPDYFKDNLIKSHNTIGLSEGSRQLNGSIELSQGSNTQQIIRPLFGKTGFSTASIGGHPDFVHLANTENSEKSSIVTMFVDMESSTRLGVLYRPEDVFRIKNAFIRMAIDVIKSLDGHVHRIMGDAVLAFFGGKTSIDEEDVVDALNCASVLVHLVKTSVIPELASRGFDKSEFGVRVGIDYGGDQDVLWSSYGHYNISEVTATSFFVDVASKLQGAAGRNQIMIGESLKEFIDFPEEYLGVKKYQVGGEEKEELFIIPNFTKENGAKLNYRKFILKSDEYLNSVLFFTGESEKNLNLPMVTNSFSLALDVFDETKQIHLLSFLPGTVSIDKDRYIRFTLRMNYQPHLPFNVNFKVVNHGKEAFKGGELSNVPYGNHDKDYKVTTQGNINFIHWEPTAFRGFHNMIITISSSTKILHEIKLGIFIK